MHNHLQWGGCGGRGGSVGGSVGGAWDEPFGASDCVRVCVLSNRCVMRGERALIFFFVPYAPLIH